MNPRFPNIFFAVALLLVVPSADAATWTTISGRVLTQTDTPLCAMVLANGQHIFSCDGSGDYNLYVPLDSSNLVTLQVFASGFAPYRDSLTADQAIGSNIYMDRDTSGRAFIVNHAEFPSFPSDRAVVTGTIEDDGVPLCAMILINGQSMFSCNQNLGQFILDVPLDNNGDITLQAFVAGYQPHRETFPGPSGKTFNQLQTERLIGTWDFFYRLGSFAYEDTYRLPGPATESTSDPGRYLLSGYDTDGNLDVVASYYPDSTRFSLFDPFSPSIAHLYQFNFNGTDAITGCFYLFQGGMFSDCYPLEGFRISTSSAQGSNDYPPPTGYPARTIP